MCGINGIFSDLFNKENIERKIILMNNLIEHRGPDASGYYTDDKTSFGSTRLSILDPTDRSDQPFLDDNKDYILTYNGEIYNYLELRSELEKLGHKFKTSGDTEVLLKSYIEWGADKLLNRIEGMFAFAIYDKLKNIIFCARDHFGQKPFFYYHDNNTFVFSSELIPLIKSGLINDKLLFSSTLKYLQYENFTREETFFKSVKKLIPGEFLIFNLKNKILKKELFWENKIYKEKFVNNDKEKIIKREIIDDIDLSIKKHVRSDVPIGIYLGGGVDSTLVAHFMKKYASNIEGFNLILTNKSFNENKLVKENFSNNNDMSLNFYSPSNSEIFNILSNSIKKMDEPISEFGFFAVSLISHQVKKKNIKVVLTGNGGDELFLGYEPFQKFNFFKIVNNSVVLQNSIKILSKILTGDFNYMSLSKKIKIFSKSLGFPDDVANSRWIAANLPEEIKEFIKDDYMRKKNLNYKLFYDFILKIRNQTNSQDNLDKLLMEYQNYYLIDCINKHTDKANMINSVEARSPLLSHHLFAKVNSLKIYHKKNKKIIKNFLSINKYKFMKRKKGFTVPIGEWINSIFKDEIIEAFSKKNLSRYGIFNHKYLNEKILEPHLLKKINNDKKIWNIFILIKWMENNIKNVHFS